MKTYDERTNEIRTKLSVKKRQRRRAITAAISMSCCLVLILGVMLMIPGKDDSTPTIQMQNPDATVGALVPPSFEQPSSTDYDTLVAVLKEIHETYYAPDFGIPEAMPEVDLVPPGSAPNGTYEEITDNQVEGVIEGDRIKRSDKYIFYLSSNALRSYSIAGADSEELDSYPLLSGYSWEDTEMYLSEDCTTITLIGTTRGRGGKMVNILNLDVSDPTNIKEKGAIDLTGTCVTSRLTGGHLYVVSRYYVPSNCDFEDSSTFLPQYGTAQEMNCLTMDEILICGEPVAAVYTVVSRLDSETLEMEDTIALLASNGDVYVSQENIYLTRSISEKTVVENVTEYKTMTEISRICYTGETLELTGAAKVEGRIHNQYSLDERDGILRVVTTLDSYSLIEHVHNDVVSVEYQEGYTSANLYCVDMDTNRIIGSVERFAPEGETVRSVRFDGEKAYVCTAVALTDPVFCFDLSDPANITWKDTGTIDGYSMSLVDMGNSFLLGIGYGASFDTVKIEIYREGESTVEPYCKYEIPNAYIYDDHKSYYIDRENQLIGMGIQLYSNHNSNNYLLLHFDGTQLVEQLCTPLDGRLNHLRAVHIDGWLYLFGEEFLVKEI